MSLFDKIKQFPDSNPDFILESKGEFLIASDVDCSNLPPYQRNIVNSYDQQILLNLSERLQKYLNDKYENVYKPISKQYEITDIKGTEKYKRIFYYAQFSDLDLIEKRIDNDSKIVMDSLKSRIVTLNFNPTEKDKNNAVLRSTSSDILDKNTYTKKFKDWYICAFEEVQNESPAYTALSIILKSLAKKGSWIEKSAEIKESAKKSFNSVSINKVLLLQQTEKEKTFFVPQSNLVTLKDLETDVVSFYGTSTLSKEKAEILFKDNYSFSNGLAIFYKFYKDPISSKNSYLIGFPKEYIEQFPNLSFSIDYKEPEISDEISFENLQDLKTSIDTLKNTINKKKESLSSNSLLIKNYNTDYLIAKIDEFVNEVNNKIQEQKYDVNKKINLFFTKKKCEQKPLIPDDPSINSLNDSEYKKCLNEFVDGQTNLYLWVAQANKNYELKSVMSSGIDGTLSAYLLANCKKIVNSSDSYTAKNFFSKLIYSKTQFEKEEKLDASTYYTAVQISYQNSFINDAANIVKYSKIKENIQKEKYKNKTVSQNIRDALADINSIKKLYETILYRFDLKDVADELLKCILSANPKLNDTIIAAEQFIQNLVKLLNVNDPNVLKIANCLNLKIPTSLGAIKLDDLPPVGDFTINKEELKTSISNLFSTAIQTVSDVDFVVPTIIKCYSEFGDEQVKILINTYVESEEARKALKKQYDQLVLEAKLYKSGPGIKDSLRKQSAEKKTFLKKAIRNAWVLLQKQAEQEAERIATEAAIQVIKSLLKDLNDCKPQNSKNTKNNQSGNPGDLKLQGNSALLDAKINNLLQELSLTLNPEKLCSLFYGSADDETIESVLSLIKQKISELYTSTQVIKLGNNIFFSEPVSSVEAARKFFISLSTAYPELTTKKCDKYFEDLSNSPFDINDQQKCIDFSDEYIKKKKEELISKGFTEEQANQIIEDQKKLQTEKYKNLQKTLEVGIYNEISSVSENHEYPVSNIVKEKIEKQLDNLTTSYAEFIDSYKDQILLLSGSSLNNYQLSLQNNQNFYNYSNNTLNIFNNSAIFKKVETINPYKEINSIYKYSSNEPYKISLKSDNYDSLQSAVSTSPYDSLQKRLKTIWLVTNSSFSNFDDKEDEFWTKNCLNNSVVIYSQKVIQNFKEDFEEIKQENFNKNKILSEIKDLIYFEEK